MDDMKPILRMDIWGGENSSDHLARQHYQLEDQAWQSRQVRELSLGFLVNLRLMEPGEGWGPSQNFDTRKEVAGRA